MTRAKRFVCAALCVVMLTCAVFASGCSLPFGLGSLFGGDAEPSSSLVPGGNAPSPSSGGTDPQPARTVLDVSAVPQDLQSFLERFGWYGYYCQSFDSAAPVNGGELGPWFRLALDLDLYPGPAAEVSSAPDPQSRWGGCLIADADKTEWILRNILHYDETAVQAARTGTASGGGYRSGDRYYLPFEGVGGGFVIYPLYAETDGTNVCVTYASYAGDGYFTFNGIQYAEVSEAALDGGVYWTISRWASQAPAPQSMTAGSDPAAFTGNWIGTGVSAQVAGAGSQLQLTLSFPGKASFTALGTLQSDGRTVVFGASDGSGFSGTATLTENSLSLRVIPMPQMTGEPYDGFFNSSFVLSRTGSDGSSGGSGGNSGGSSGGSSGAGYDVAALVSQISGWYNNPGDSDRYYYAPIWEMEWPYYRDYFFHDNSLVYAFLYNSDGSIEIYYWNGEPIRYIDSGYGTHDYGSITEEEQGIAAQVIADGYWHLYNPSDPVNDVDVGDICDQIEAHYMNPKVDDDIVTVPIWELEWPYARQYLFMYGEISYALLYNDSESIAMYFYSGDLIRYVDSYGNTTDLGNFTEQQLNLAQSAIGDAYWFYYGAGADGKGDDEEGSVDDLVAWIQDHYYNSGSDDIFLYVPIWEYEWPYHREYMFCYGDLAFAYLYNDSEELRLYFYGGGLIRYIDTAGNITDSPNLTEEMLNLGGMCQYDAELALNAS